MSIPPRRVLVGVLVACGAIGVSAAFQRTAPAAGVTARAVTAADAFLQTLDESQRRKANLDFNEQTRVVWSNLPTGIKMQVGAMERNGLKLGAMTPVQEKAALALVAATLSADGFRKAMAIVDADQERDVPRRAAVLRRAADARVRFGRAEYSVAILGTPSADARWMLQFGGHHLAINVTLAGSANVLAPTHTGAQPASYSVGGKLIRPLGDENDRAFELVNALTDEQKKQAILSYEVRNLVLGPGTDGKSIAPEGVRASTFTPAQRATLLALVREWVGMLEDQAANAKMKEIESGLNETYFAWAGSTTNGKGAYFRVQGPAVFLEYAPQGAGENNVDHIHTIYREPANDYAARAARR